MPQKVEIEFDSGITLVFGEIKFKDVYRIMKKYAKKLGTSALNETAPQDTSLDPDMFDFLKEIVVASIYEAKGVDDISKWIDELPFSDFMRLVEYALQVNPLLQAEPRTG